jgi:hypothetical protein
MDNQICEFCGLSFPKPKRERRGCSRSCSTKLSQAAKGKHAWTEEELDYLRDRLGLMPFHRLIDSYLRNSEQLGFPERTRMAVEVKMQKLIKSENLSRKCTLNNWTVHELARILGVTSARVRSWCDISGLRKSKVARNQSAIARKALKEWMLERPELVSDIEKERLDFVLEDPQAVRKIKRHKPSQRGYPRPVICLGTGEKYPSVTAAAKANYLSKCCVIRAIRTGNTSAGHRWAYLPREA